MQQKTIGKACCFFGNRNFPISKKAFDVLEEELERMIFDDNYSTFYFGRYGIFDSSCYQVVSRLKARYQHIKRTLVYAYYPKKVETDISLLYEETVYPQIENTPPRYAILARNKYIIDLADFCFFHVFLYGGGSAQALRYAMAQKKQYINLIDKVRQ